MISDCDDSHGRHVRWALRGRNATEAIRERWVGTSWITTLCTPVPKPFYVLCGSVGCTALQKPGGYENHWHWPRDTQLGEDAYRYSQSNGNGFCSIRAGLIAVAHDISRMLDWVGISAAGTG